MQWKEVDTHEAQHAMERGGQTHEAQCAMERSGQTHEAQCATLTRLSMQWKEDRLLRRSMMERGGQTHEAQSPQAE